MIRHFILSALFVITGLVGFTQQYNVNSKYFVYLQTEPAQPFYIRINGQQVSANASGYLILPQLKDGDYKLVVGFPLNKAPEKTFNFKIDSKDKGYLIKNFGAEGWGLFDLQTMAIQKPTSADGAQAIVAEPKKETPKPVATPAEGVSDFTKVLSQAANDPSLLEKPKPVEEEKPVPEPEVKKTEQKPILKERATENQSAQNALEPSRSSKGVVLVYDDRNESGQVDPITIFIPEPNQSVKEKEAIKNLTPHNEPQKLEDAAPKSENGNAGSTITEEKTPAVIAETTNVTPIGSNNTNSQKKIDTQQNNKEQETIVAEKVGNCKNVASDEDFLKLRKQMAIESNDDGMIEQAKKAFKNKCYTTAQIKYLSSMFLSNAGKYNFYEAAYNYVANKEEFPALVSEIKDAFYKDKFNSLIK